MSRPSESPWSGVDGSALRAVTPLFCFPTHLPPARSCKADLHEGGSLSQVERRRKKEDFPRAVGARWPDHGDEASDCLRAGKAIPPALGKYSFSSERNLTAPPSCDIQNFERAGGRRPGGFNRFSPGECRTLRT